ncbi:HAD-IA family hydrolase [Thalassotalea sp. LPB0316]|uniref:HAD family hydrolase n=1 Tax=Thalassotalea sp. LPB0316 TaxID=2769490 RepID=UPI0018679991|nr:HAD-IA family hydrolase [Thalassotalea sp. LPB0316]QOL24784.1 HAD-IA family hydrolase [Thalassotalea sp. LPB0316]
MKKVNHPIEAVLFDLDGTILDTADDLGAALNFVLTQYQLPLVAPNDYRPVASDGALGLLRLGFGDLLDNYDYEQLRAEFLEYYQQNIATHTKIYAGLEDTLQSLSQAAIPWGIITNKPIGLTNELLPHFPLLADSAINLGGDSLAKKKPDPLPMHVACQALNVKPENCLYIGDAPRDIEAGNAANMTTVIAGWGYILDHAKCNQWHADIFAKTTEDLHQIIFTADRTNYNQTS